VLCQDARRPGAFEHTSFTFLGYTFRPRLARGSPDVVVGLFPAGKFELEATAGEHRHGDEGFG